MRVPIYQKSLLYLVSRALERDTETPLLGLEVCLRNDARLRDMFGLGGRHCERGEVIWSPTLLETGRSASRCGRHGGFDDDPATMNSVARRVLGADDNDPHPGFPQRAHRQEWRRRLGGAGRLASGHGVAVHGWRAEYDARPYAPCRPTPGDSPYHAADTTRGTRCHGGAAPRALCGYRPVLQGTSARLRCRCGDLAGNARRLGFSEIAVLHNHQATREAILAGLSELVTTSRAGDVVVFQFAGHGTQLPDMGSDEADGDTPGQDEALCPSILPMALL